jgi:hypothetical protein
MSKKSGQGPINPPYEIGYGKPPVQGQFQKGRSGNPKGRPRKEKEETGKAVAKPRSDAASRDLFLQFAERTVSGRGGEGDVRITAEEAVLHSLLSAAAKGSPHAQKYFLERLDSYRADVSAEIAEEHDFWHDYSEKYSKVVERIRKTGEAVPDDWPHPEDLLFDHGKHVMLRGGATAPEAKKNGVFSPAYSKQRTAHVRTEAATARCVDRAESSWMGGHRHIAAEEGRVGAFTGTLNHSSKTRRGTHPINLRPHGEGGSGRFPIRRHRCLGGPTPLRAACRGTLSIPQGQAEAARDHSLGPI